MPRDLSRPKHLAWAVVAAALAALLLVMVPAVFSAGESSASEPVPSDESAAEPNNEIPTESVATPNVIPGVPDHLRAFAVERLPDGFRMETNEFQDHDATRTDRVYMAFIRGTDPDTDPEWGIIRVRVLYRSFDAKAWFDAYGAENQGGQIGDSWRVELTEVGGNANALLEIPAENAESGYVLRFGDDELQVMVSSTPGVSEADVRAVAERIVEVSR